ncbi:MAG: addiction module toxin RelE [Rhodospirillales bacterium]|nr:addiction module toxin RelE [Rhodospirillales bacterium]
MKWNVEFHPEFLAEFTEMTIAVQDEMSAHIELIGAVGPALKRPHADTLNGSKHVNMKELRFKADGGVWRLAYAFDPERKAILLVAGDKSGVSQKRFYAALIAKADLRYDGHLAYLMKKGRKQ